MTETTLAESEASEDEDVIEIVPDECPMCGTNSFGVSAVNEMVICWGCGFSLKMHEFEKLAREALIRH